MKGARALMWRLAVLCACCLLLGGCWSRVELNEIGIVSATGVDWKDNKWTLTYQVVMPPTPLGQRGSAGKAAAVHVLSTSAESFRAAARKASQESARRLYFAHNQMLVIGQEAARHGLEQLFDVYIRNPESRKSVSVFLTKGSARRTLEQLAPLAEMTGNAMRQLIAQGEKESPDFPEMSMHDIMVELLGASQATGIPSLVASGVDESSSDSSRKLAHPAAKLRLNQMGLIDRNKLIGWISREEGFGVMWLSNKIKHTTLAFSCPANEPAGKQSAVQISGAATKLTPEWSEGKWTMHVKAEGQGRLVEYGCLGDLQTPEALKDVNQLVEQEIIRLIEKGWQSLRANKADVVGFGNMIHKKHPKQWAKQKRDWPEQFARMNIKVSAHIKLQSTGMSGSSFKKAQDQARS
jgi:spore germination protein KC